MRMRVRGWPGERMEGPVVPGGGGDRAERVERGRRVDRAHGGGRG
ncbi:hypothetical protein SLNWT_1827 [Streptomyces albus]|uniref:Uncharacterized protein n=1 Tax=Streptomyces albus (strain ATCC 21838 / DSM 41398 / FERM P-419 / JCM 4703 / NBRC 107858) TaxID=1081613 RepID=A0A0B5EIV6_STRA4|nr:hypothetical protein SLNWT_1827 [Streptomyces albus]AOU76518.1 hypothetical protein SLNHY_1827 [Streptomyces albus]